MTSKSAGRPCIRTCTTVGRGGVNVIPRYMAGDRSARIVKYYSRLNLGHFSDHAEDYMLDTRTENTGVEERLDREGGEGSGV